MSAYLTLEADTTGRLENDTKEEELMSDISRVSHYNLGEDDIPRELIRSVDIRDGNSGGQDSLNRCWDSLRGVLDRFDDGGGSVDNGGSSFHCVEDGLGDVRGSLIGYSIGFGSTVEYMSETDREGHPSGNAPGAGLNTAGVDRGDRAGGAT
jgi:hypothetical protein